MRFARFKIQVSRFKFMKRILIIGGANGIGLSMAHVLAERAETTKIYVVDKAELAEEFRHEKIESVQFDLTCQDYSIFDQFQDIDGLIITAGFGRLALFKDIPEEMIAMYFNVNTIPVIRIIKHFYDKLLSKEDFYCVVMSSIAGFMSSPFLSIYGATKAAQRIFIESVNVELEKAGTNNRILNVSPGSIAGTSFNQGKTDLALTRPLAEEILSKMEAKEDLFIPKYDEVFREVLDRYHADFRKEGLHSYNYKIESGRVKEQK